MPPEPTEQARARRDTKTERAIGRGSAEILSAYFRDIAAPSCNVLQGIVRCLVGDGAGNQTLRFKRRSGGRPSKRNEEPFPTDAEAAAIMAFSGGDERALACYLDSGNISDRVRRLLADAFDICGTTRQKLVFKRARAGNPVSDLRSDLEKAFLGHTAEVLKNHRGTSWDKIDDELYMSEQLKSADNTKRKRAVQFVRRALVAKSKKPSE